MVTEEITFLPLCLYSRYLNCCLCNKAQSWPKFQLSTTDMSETHTHANVCLHTLTQNKHFRDIIYNAFSWTVNPLNENNHRNPTVAPTTPLILSISLSQSPHLAYSLHTCGHLSIGHGRMKTACAGWSDWLDHVFCWQTVHSSFVRGEAEPECAHKAEKAVSSRLTSWLLESFGRVDDHMQKAVQARSLLIWKTSTRSC